MVTIPLLCALYRTTDFQTVQSYVVKSTKERRRSDRDRDFNMPETLAQLELAKSIVQNVVRLEGGRE